MKMSESSQLVAGVATLRRSGEVSKEFLAWVSGGGMQVCRTVGDLRDLIDCLPADLPIEGDIELFVGVTYRAAVEGEGNEIEYPAYLQVQEFNRREVEQENT